MLNVSNTSLAITPSGMNSNPSFVFWLTQDSELVIDSLQKVES
jgi:hypothetical protein